MTAALTTHDGGIVLSPPQQAIADRIKTMTTEEKYGALKAAIVRTAHDFVEQALLIKSLEDEGEDLSGLRLTMLHSLRRVACGQLLPEVLVMFAGCKMMIQMIGNLPITEQHKVVNGEPFKLVERSRHGTTHRMVNIVELNPEEFYQLVAGDHIRSEAEQSLYLERKQKKAMRPLPTRVDDFDLDLEELGAVIGRRFYPLASLERAVDTLRKARASKRNQPASA